MLMEVYDLSDVSFLGERKVNCFQKTKKVIKDATSEYVKRNHCLSICLQSGEVYKALQWEAFS